MQIIDFITKKNIFARGSTLSGKHRDGLTDLYNGLYQEHYFCEMLSLERKRSERSRKPFLLMLIDLNRLEDGFDRHLLAKKVAEIMHPLTRDTDIKGWYKYGYILGVIFCEITDHERSLKSAQKLIANKCGSALKVGLDPEELDRVVVTWHIFPGRFDKVFSEEQEHTKVYPDLLAKMAGKRYALFTKRIIDVFGSLFALVLFTGLYCSCSFNQAYFTGACIVQTGKSWPVWKTFQFY
jgi:hypothetical protein